MVVEGGGTAGDQPEEHTRTLSERDSKREHEKTRGEGKFLCKMPVVKETFLDFLNFLCIQTRRKKLRETVRSCPSLCKTIKINDVSRSQGCFSLP